MRAKGEERDLAKGNGYSGGSGNVFLRPALTVYLHRDPASLTNRLPFLHAQRAFGLNATGISYGAFVKIRCFFNTNSLVSLDIESKGKRWRASTKVGILETDEFGASSAFHCLSFITLGCSYFGCAWFYWLRKALLMINIIIFKEKQLECVK